MFSLHNLFHITHPWNLIAIGVHFCYLGADNFGWLVQVITSLPICFHREFIEQEDTISHRWLRKINNGAKNDCGKCLPSTGFLWPAFQDMIPLTMAHSQLPQCSDDLCIIHDPHVLWLIWVISISQVRWEATNQGLLLVVSNSGLNIQTG